MVPRACSAWCLFAFECTGPVSSPEVHFNILVVEVKCNSCVRVVRIVTVDIGCVRMPQSAQKYATVIVALPIIMMIYVFEGIL